MLEVRRTFFISKINVPYSSLSTFETAVLFVIEYALKINDKLFWKKKKKVIQALRKGQENILPLAGECQCSLLQSDFWLKAICSHRKFQFFETTALSFSFSRSSSDRKGLNLNICKQLSK